MNIRNMCTLVVCWSVAMFSLLLQSPVEDQEDESLGHFILAATCCFYARRRSLYIELFEALNNR